MDRSSTTVAIPATIEEAVGALNGIDALLTAKGWERAAIVYAFTADQQGTQGDQKKVSDRLGINEFANLGITGLTSAPTVRIYRNAWAEHGEPDIQPGDTVTLPTTKFPPRDDTNFGTRVSPDKAALTVSEWSPEAKAAAVTELIRDREITDTVVEEIVLQPDLIDKAEQHPMMQVPDVQAPVKQRTMDDCYREIKEHLHHMLIDMDHAISLMEEAVLNGWGVGDLEWRALAQTPDPTLQDAFTEFGKLVGTIQIDQARI